MNLNVSFVAVPYLKNNDVNSTSVGADCFAWNNNISSEVDHMARSGLENSLVSQAQCAGPMLRVGHHLKACVSYHTHRNYIV